MSIQLTFAKRIYQTSRCQADSQWEEWIADFIVYLQTLGRSEATRKTRWQQLTIFSRQVGLPIDQVTAHDVIRVLAQGKRGAEARRGLRTAVKTFYDYLIRIRRMDVENPCDAVPVIREQAARERICPEQAVSRGVSSQDRQERMAVMLAAWMGLRCREISLTSTWDIRRDKDGADLLVHGKGGKQRVIPIPARLLEEIEDAGVIGWLFPGRFQGPADPSHIRDLIKRATGGYPPHCLRRRFATQTYYASGHDILAVSKLLGHATITTTQRYLGAQPAAYRDLVEEITLTGLRRVTIDYTG